MKIIDRSKDNLSVVSTDYSLISVLGSSSISDSQMKIEKLIQNFDLLLTTGTNLVVKKKSFE